MADGLGISQDDNPNIRTGVSIGYIILPIFSEKLSEEERSIYIENCYRNEIVSIQIEGGGGVIHNCSITKQALESVEFPSNYNELGSAVVFLSEPYSGHIIIIGVLRKSDSTSFFKERGWNRTITCKDGGYISVSLDGENNTVNISSSGSKNPSSLKINVTNIDENSSLDVNVKGSINIYCEGGLNIKNVGGDISVVTDKNISVNAAKYVLNGGNEVPLLGNKTTEQLDKEKQALSDLIDKISQLNPVPVPPGSVDATWAALKLAIKSITDRADYTDIKSKEIFFK